MRVAQNTVKKTTPLTLTKGSAVPAQLKPILDMREVFDPDREYQHEEPQPELSFKVGAPKLYVLKDLYAFKAAFTNSDMLKLGKSQEVVCDRAAFGTESLPMIDFIFRNLQGSPHTYTTRYYYRYYDYQAKKTFDLTPEMVDDFFDALAETGVPELAVKTQAGKNTLQEFLVTDGNAELSLECIREPAGVVLRCNQVVNMLSGAHHLYLFTGNTIFRCTADFTQAASALLKAVISEPGGLFFADKDVPALLGTVLLTAL